MASKETFGSLPKGTKKLDCTDNEKVSFLLTID